VTIMKTSPLYLVAYSGYTTVQLALFKDTILIDRVQEDNKRSSRNFIPLLNDMLERQKITLDTIQFLAAYQGPGPFTTLRVVIASVNGLAFATRLPLIGVDGLVAFLHEQKENMYDYTVVLLNAFCNDVYWGIYEHATEAITTGSTSIEAFLDQLAALVTNQQEHPKNRIKLVGNAIKLYHELILGRLGACVTIPQPLPQECSLESVAYQARNKWTHRTDLTEQLLPLYLKGYSAKTCLQIRPESTSEPIC
jgi:tRNA threonylcarbamoyl adenosine modification protein YeaZ